jgi:hypothetical protein
MGPEGEWIRGEPEEDDGPDDDSLDDEWLDDESSAGPEWPMGHGGRPGPGLGYGKDWGHGGVPGFSGWVAVAVAIVAAAAGVAAGFFLIRGVPAASAAGQATPSASASPSAGRGGGPRALPGLPGLPGGAGGNGQLRMLLTGRVLAVSGTSVTIGGTGPSVTAAITGATTITGRAHGIGGVKVGDEVAAQITGTPSHLVTTTLQDPAP